MFDDAIKGKSGQNRQIGRNDFNSAKSGKLSESGRHLSFALFYESNRQFMVTTDQTAPTQRHMC